MEHAAADSHGGVAVGGLVCRKRVVQTVIKALDERQWRKTRVKVSSYDDERMVVAVVPEGVRALDAHSEKPCDGVPAALRDSALSQFEICYGLLGIAQGLEFLGRDAHRVALAVTPANIYLCGNGAWKLGGFGFSAACAPGGGGGGAECAYFRAGAEVPAFPLAPDLRYAAPELTAAPFAASPAADAFALGAVCYELLESPKQGIKVVRRYVVLYWAVRHRYRICLLQSDSAAIRTIHNWSSGDSSVGRHREIAAAIDKFLKVKSVKEQLKVKGSG